MKLLILIASFSLLHAACNAQSSDFKTERVAVSGNCSICKSAIENAANVRKLSEAEWDENTKMAAITYDSKKTSLQAVLKSIALAGYDNEQYLAPDETYNKLQSCCQYERKNKGVMTASSHKEARPGNPEQSAANKAPIANPTSNTGVVDGPVMQIVKQTQSSLLEPVFLNYFGLKDALVKSDSKVAATKAATLLSSLNAVKTEALTPAEQAVWKVKEKDLKARTASISKLKQAAAQRAQFAQLSETMYAVVKSTKPAGKIYWQNCPMYNEGKGANWLSKESSVKNPYYGSMMLSCGKTIETIQ